MGSPYGEDVAVLKDQMKDVKDALIRIETKQDLATAIYATKSELRAFKWVTVTTVIIVTAFITALVAFFFAHLGSTANDPTTSSTTTVNTPGGSTSTTSTKDGMPSTTSSTATAHSDAAQPADSQTSNGGVTVTVPKLP